MGKIIAKSIKFRNFLSYGNTWSEVEFKDGINMILGRDAQKDRSNGAGKTSFSSAIEFALFGEISKDISQSKIINWRNGKNCEVVFEFEKDGITYIIERGLRPSKLNVIKNGIPVPVLSDKKAFQLEIENDIIGMDFKTSSSLMSMNPNNSVSIFNTPKPVKRKFIENFFNLSLYSKAAEATNKKISKLEEVLRVGRIDIDMKKKRLEELISSIPSKDNLPDINRENEIIRDLELKVEHFGQLPSYTKDDIDLLEKTREKYQQSLKNVESFGKDIVYIDLQIYERQKNYAALTKEMNDIEHILKEEKENTQKYSEFLLKSEHIPKQVETDTKGLDDISIELSKLIDEKHILETNLATLRGKLSVLPDISILDGATTCPVCLQDCSYEKVKGHYEKFAEPVRIGIENIESKVSDIDIIIKKYNESIDTLKNNIKKCQKIVDTRNDFSIKLAKSSNMDSNLDRLTKIRENIIIDEKQIKDHESRKKCFERENIKELDILCDLKKLVLDMEQAKISGERSKTDYENAKIELDHARKSYEKTISYLNDFLKRESDLNSQIEDTKNEIATIQKESIGKERLLDHLKCVKGSLKDEEVKQFAIGNIVPYLNQKANYYLSETGHNYQITLDNWLEGTIHGIGVGECDFGNMSAGEAKTIDLAVKFAIMDVAKIQSGSYIDLLILDELLDSSIDSYGLEKLMDIIKIKQRDDDLKVFIISHREEITDFGYDRLYEVTKNHGFSTIGEMV